MMASASYPQEPSSVGEYSGSGRLPDGSRVMFTQEEAKTLWEASEAAQQKTAADFPTFEITLRELSRAFHRLRDFGWREGIYCPKDGSEFEVIEAGSTGIFRCRYDGTWPEGMWMTFDDSDVYPSSSPPLMFRLLPEAQAEHDRKVAEAVRRYRDENDR